MGHKRGVCGGRGEWGKVWWEGGVGEGVVGGGSGGRCGGRGEWGKVWWEGGVGEGVVGGGSGGRGEWGKVSLETSLSHCRESGDLLILVAG